MIAGLINGGKNERTIRGCIESKIRVLTILEYKFAGTGLRANAPGFTSPELFPGNLQGALPSFTFSGATANFAFTQPQNIDNPSYTYRDNLTIAHGQHTLKFGGFYSREAKDENAGNALNGSYAFDGSRSGNDLADFLLGAPRTYLEDQNEVRVQLRYNTWEFYGQDSWKVTPRLTIDYGARYALYGNPIELSNFLTSFRPDLYNPATAVKIDPVSGNILTGAGDKAFIAGADIGEVVLGAAAQSGAAPAWRFARSAPVFSSSRRSLRRTTEGRW